MRATNQPIPPRNVNFDPSEMRTLTHDDKNNLAPRYNERLQIASSGPGDRARVIAYIGQGNTFMRLINAARVGDSDRWVTTAHPVIHYSDPEPEAAEEAPRSCVMDVTDLHQAELFDLDLEMVRFDGMNFLRTGFTPGEFAPTHGRTFIPS